MGNFSDQQMNELLQKASKKMGTTPDELKRKLEGQNINDALKNMNPNDAAKVQQVLANPAAAFKLAAGTGVAEKINGGKINNG